MTKNQRHDKKKSSPKGKRKLDFIEKKRTKTPLTGKTIFLDIKETKVKKRLEEDIIKLGAKVETFLSKDINYLITANPPAKPTGNEDKYGSPESPSISTPSPFNMGASPSPSNPESVKNTIQTVSRGKAIFNKAKIATKNNIVVENAQKWGVKIVGLEVAQKWIQKEVLKLPLDTKKDLKGKKTCSTSKGDEFKVKKLKRPFLKFEDTSHQYKIVYKHLETWPHVNVDTPKGSCPFDGTRVGKDDESVGDRRDKIGLPNLEVHSEDECRDNTCDSNTPIDGKIKKSDSIIGPVRIMTAGDIRRKAERKRLLEKKRGYCECCLIRYEHIDQHIKNEQHKQFVRDKKNYESLDILIKNGSNCNTAKFLQRTLTTHLRKGKTISEDVDTSIPEAKQWTPRKSAAAKIAMKKQRNERKDDITVKQKNHISTVRQPREIINVKEKKKSLRKTEENVIDSSKTQQEESSMNEKECPITCINGNESNTSTQDSKCQKSEVKRMEGVTSRIECERDMVIDKLDDLTVNSEVQISLSALNVNSSGMNTSLNEDSLLNMSSKEIKDNQLAMSKNDMKYNNGSVDKIVQDDETCIQNGPTTKGDKMQNNKKGKDKIKQSCAKNDKLPHYHNVNEARNNRDKVISCESVEVKKDNEETSQTKVNIENHYVPKAKSFFMQQNMSLCRVDWGDFKNIETQDAKVVVKRWSQKLETSNQPLKKNITDKTEKVDFKGADLTEKSNLSNNDREMANKKTNHKVSSDKKYCLEKTICTNELSKQSPARKVKGYNKTPMLSPIQNDLQQSKNNKIDVYDFKDTPQKCKDVYAMSSEISLIGTESPKLNRKHKTPSSANRMKLQSHESRKFNSGSPRSGTSTTPGSARKKMWRKPNSIPKSAKFDSKKLKRFKLPVDSLSSSNTDSRFKSNTYLKETCQDLKTSTKIKSTETVNKLLNKKNHAVVKVAKDVSGNEKNNVSCGGMLRKRNKNKKSHETETNIHKTKDISLEKKKSCLPYGTEEVSHRASPLPSSVKHTCSDNKRYETECAPSTTKKKPAIKRLSPSKPFNPDNTLGTIDQAKNTKEKTPQKSQKSLLRNSVISPSNRKSPMKILVWKAANLDIIKSKKVKLNTSWSLLSDRSVGKLLASDDGNNEQFDGFSKEDITAESSLDSDASFVETTEIDMDENSHQEWVINAELVNEDSNDIQDLVPVFTSPGKRSDSSWGDACEEYIQSQVSFNNSNTKSMLETFSSPKKFSPRKRKRLCSEEDNTFYKSALHCSLLRSPNPKRKRRKVLQDGIEKVDNEIEFNHLSPQKLRGFVSPVKNCDEETMFSSSPLKGVCSTSTPFRLVSGIEESKLSRSAPLNFTCKQRKSCEKLKFQKETDKLNHHNKNTRSEKSKDKIKASKFTVKAQHGRSRSRSRK
ncbi:Hypothetical predicted protein [Mytilus galloprovincialis]|uniref:DBF4-type domain-containing protein n=1 Tax=Mytilus galloprovincialis TaxID=29158 RepID=A0A8B6C6Q6_MYTGA|nr:Hypothetical predicted protein [Mytilus galloprovincialis]